ncbi:MAG: hypothetical protein DME17_08235 [Candidatus Rokuibacteriota bacterium]|nr:MAG: hypothetical protein DME17_08235 [Candidatus Rokubacteria bacterium]
MTHALRLVEWDRRVDVESTWGDDDMTAERLPVAPIADGLVGGLPVCRLRRVTQYIQDNLQRELRLAELSELVHMSPFHFARLFKRSTGASPHRFLVRRRIEQAAALLAAQPLPIGEIARSVGFRTPSHFTTTFRRVTGITPTAYRRGGTTATRGASSAAVSPIGVGTRA